jgi:hypothetical protein
MGQYFFIGFPALDKAPDRTNPIPWSYQICTSDRFLSISFICLVYLETSDRTQWGTYLADYR